MLPATSTKQGLFLPWLQHAGQPHALLRSGDASQLCLGIYIWSKGSVPGQLAVVFPAKLLLKCSLFWTFFRDSAISFPELSQRLGIPFLETERYFVLISDFLLNTTCLEKNTCGHHCRKKTPADLDWTFSPLLETNLARSGWYVFRWSLCGKGGSLQQLWCLLYHWGWWGYTSQVGLVYFIKRIVWIRENLFDIFFFVM